MYILSCFLAIVSSTVIKISSSGMRLPSDVDRHVAWWDERLRALCNYSGFPLNSLGGALSKLFSASSFSDACCLPNQRWAIACQRPILNYDLIYCMSSIWMRVIAISFTCPYFTLKLLEKSGYRVKCIMNHRWLKCFWIFVHASLWGPANDFPMNQWDLSLCLYSTCGQLMVMYTTTKVNLGLRLAQVVA